MEKLNIEELERIPIPEGLEERLSMKIDEWEKAEKEEVEASKEQEDNILSMHRFRYMKIASIAAAFILVIGIGLYMNSGSKGHTDTYSDPQTAYNEAEKAIELLAANLNKGFDAYSEANEKGANAQRLLYKYFK